MKTVSNKFKVIGLLLSLVLILGAVGKLSLSASATEATDLSK